MKLQRKLNPDARKISPDARKIKVKAKMTKLHETERKQNKKKIRTTQTLYLF